MFVLPYSKILFIFFCLIRVTFWIVEDKKEYTIRVLLENLAFMLKTIFEEKRKKKKMKTRKKKNNKKKKK